MKLSVVTVCYNDLDALKKTVDSVLIQGSKDFEMIIQDGGSTDGTIEYLNTLEQRFIRFFSQKDSGIYDGMNRAVLNASNEYVYFLNAGDVFYDDKVIEDINILLASKPELVFSKVLCVSKDYQLLKGRPVSESDFRFGMPVSHQGIIYRKIDVISECYDLNYRIIADLKLTKNILNKIEKSIYFDRIICSFDLTGVSSTQHFRMLKERLMLAFENRDFVALFVCILFEYPKYSLIRLLRLFGVYNRINRFRYKKHL